MADHDPHLDATLRNVPPPADAARLASADAVFSDDALDRLLADLAVPTGLVDRLRAAVDQPGTSGRGGVIDLERITSRPPVAERRRSLLGRWGVALARDGFAVAAALSVAWAVFTIGHEVSSRLAAPVDNGSAIVAATRPAAMPDRSASATAAPTPTAPPAGRSGDAAAGSREPLPTAAAIAATAEVAPDDVAVAAVPSPAAPSVRGAAVGVAVPPSSVGMGSVAERLVDQPREAWRLVPRVRGFDLAFEMAHGEQPFADPSIRGLSTDAPPLSLRTASFDRLATGTAAWKSPVRGFRMEDLLAAIPAPSVSTAMSAGDTVALQLVGVRSLRRVRGQPSLLVEVAATAGGRHEGHAPLDATLVIDRSTGVDPMIWRWLCASLGAIAGAMDPDDRLSIVVAGPMPRVALSRGDSAAVAAAAADLVHLPPTDVADLDAAVRLATSPPESSPRPLVVLAQRDSAERAREEARMALAAWHESQASAESAMAADVARPRVGFVLVDATAGPGGAPAATTFGSTAADATAIRREAIRQVFAADLLVARQCRLAVSFKPGTVASWRLVGHRQSVVESLATTRPAPLDLHAGETVRAIYEVVPRGTTVPVVAAELDWQAADGGPRRARATLETIAADPAAALPSPHGCEVLLAVAVAEAAGGSVHADPAATAAAAELTRRWRERGDVSPFGAVLATCLERQAGGRRMPR